MPKLLAPGEPYSGRRSDAVVMNTTLDAEAAEVLRQYCPPGRKATGRFLTRLLDEHDARQHERQRMRQQVVALMEGDGVSV